MPDRHKKRRAIVLIPDLGGLLAGDCNNPMRSSSGDLLLLVSWAQRQAQLM
jgi:hypothetical protein